MSEHITDEIVEAGVRGLVAAAKAEAPAGMDVEALAVAGAANLAHTIRVALEAAAPLIETRALNEAADDWQRGEWADAPRRADRVQERIANGQYVGDWLRARADRLTATQNAPQDAQNSPQGSATDVPGVGGGPTAPQDAPQEFDLCGGEACETTGECQARRGCEWGEGR